MIVARRSFSGAVASLLFVVLVISAKADLIPPCAPPAGVTSTSLKDVPPALMQALKARLIEIAAPNVAPDAPGLVVAWRNRPFSFVWNISSRWIVAGYTDQIFAYDLTEDGRSASLVEERIAFPNTVCKVASELIASR
jgi:hypothetical protein